MSSDPQFAASRPAIRGYFSAKRTLIPLILAVSSLGFFFWKFFDPQQFRSIIITPQLTFWLFVALCMVGIRASGYIVRLKIISRKSLNWRQCFQLVFLWEYASAVTPSTVGGSAVAIYLIAKEKVKTGYSTAMVLIATFLDELYFIVLAPVFLIGLGGETLFGSRYQCPGVDDQLLIGNLRDLSIPFFAGYFLLLSLTLLITVGLFFRPAIFRSMLRWIFSIPFLKRYRQRADLAADDMELAAAIYKKENLVFWLKAGAATFMSWTARYLALNFIFIAFTGSGFFLEIFSRQFVMWIIMLIPATPGGSFVAETVFTTQLCPYVALALLPVVMLVWRMFTYLPYLFIGPVILPIWMKRVNS